MDLDVIGVTFFLCVCSLYYLLIVNEFLEVRTIGLSLVTLGQ